MEGHNMMTRKDYQLIAKVISETLDHMGNNPSYRLAIDTLTNSLCHELTADNPRFNDRRFWEACHAPSNDERKRTNHPLADYTM